VSGRALGLYLGENHPIIIDRSARNTPIPGGGRGRGAKGTRQADRTLSSEKAPDASRVYPLLVPLRCLDRVQDEDGARGWGRGRERRKETSDRVWSIIRIDSALGTSPGFQRGFTTNAILRCDRAETSTAITTPTGGGSISRRKIEHPDNEREKERERDEEKKFSSLINDPSVSGLALRETATDDNARRCRSFEIRAIDRVPSITRDPANLFLARGEWTRSLFFLLCFLFSFPVSGGNRYLADTSWGLKANILE